MNAFSNRRFHFLADMACSWNGVEGRWRLDPVDQGDSRPEAQFSRATAFTVLGIVTVAVAQVADSSNGSIIMGFRHSTFGRVADLRPLASIQ